MIALNRSKQFLIFGILAGGIFGVISTSPTIYAIVEPHITITMDPGQTTKPFQIKDDLGTEILSVDPDGVIRSIGQSVVLVYEADGPIIVSNPLPNSDFVAKWKITKPAGALDNEIVFLESVKYAEIKRNSGTSFVEISIRTSSDDVTYSFESGIAGNSDTNEALLEGNSGLIGIPGDTRYIAVGLETLDAATTGEVRNVKIFEEILLPHGWTIERVL